MSVSLYSLMVSLSLLMATFNLGVAVVVVVVVADKFCKARNIGHFR